ncbi:PIN domain-containing protein [Lentisphaera profundi]|uniref:PIN domain-containing protein n=1 Tax=Lentisphaera profundi TaxID=1658616 RepID=A0ABY7VNA2_9BACT|nr:PIN domain-containing protein [Lentisphaera profundi]WDE95585.1 PIN domain-containing protein [Lentisphaera profundi]
MRVLVDSSIWISYFRNGHREDVLDFLIEENLIVINDIILAELVPFLKIQNKLKLIRHLESIEKLSLSIDWDDIIKTQTKCLKTGVSGIGILDLIIAQNAIQNTVCVFSEDKHFIRLNEVTKLEIYN